MKKQINEICKGIGVAVISIMAILIIIRTLSWQQSIIKRVMVTREGFGHDDSDSDNDSDSDSDSDSGSDSDGDEEEAIDRIHKNNKKIKKYGGLMDKSKSIKKYKKYEEKITDLKNENETLLSGGGGSMF